MGKMCNNCNAENNMVMIPYIVHEEAIAKEERHIKRLWIAIILAVALIFASNIAWLIHDTNKDSSVCPCCTDCSGNSDMQADVINDNNYETQN